MLPNPECHSSRASSTNSPPLWQDEAILRHLYCKREYSLRETADRLGCVHATVRRWLRRFNIETRDGDHQKVHPCYEVNPEGYAYAKISHPNGEDRVGIHELVAIAAGADPYRVFSDTTHCHHRVRIPGGFDGAAQLDLPDNLEVLDAREHISAHQSGDLEEPEPGEILARTDDSTDRGRQR